MLKRSGVLGFRIDGAFDLESRGHTIEPTREPPVAVAEQFHRGWNENHANESGVNEDCRREAYTEDLYDERVAERKAREDRHHDEGGGGDYSGRRGETVG